MTRRHLSLLLAVAILGCVRTETVRMTCRTDADLVLRAAADQLRRDGFRVPQIDEAAGLLHASKRGFAAWLPASRRSGATVDLAATHLSPSRVEIFISGSWRPFPYVWTIGCHPAEWVLRGLVEGGFEPIRGE